MRGHSDFGKIADGMERKAEAAVDETMDRIEADWKSRVRVDTGEYRDSIHGEKDSPLSGAVVSDVEHAIYNELGTYKMSAQPGATPAAEAARQPFLDAMRKIVEP